MIRLGAGLALLLMASVAAMAQSTGPNTRVINENDYKPRQRYVCVVPAQDSAKQKYPNVCRAQEGRVGGRCRCDGVVGNGTLQLGG